MENNILQIKTEESLKRIQEAFKLAQKDAISNLKLSHIVKAKYNDNFEKETIFGFNVRLKSDDVIIPLLGGDIWKTYRRKNNQDFTKK